VPGIAYDPDTALAEQLIDISDELEATITQYEGEKQEQIKKINSRTHRANAVCATPPKPRKYDTKPFPSEK